MNTRSKAAKAADPADFETALAELETLVASMERGDLPLEAALTAYRRGAELLKFCQARLADTEQQVRILDAELLKPFESTPPESAV
ncbi:exodeoxyribonuclease VII small subunit [Parachitinimonas caeni]|uniref:Exodeoxyribonuclease 7 small subunit n=1 Tax=Parachitinimonas caeni TaxID=3031301 RepID=A0ABT7DUK9_9NEIS|nr:exodeoxyribonuclease VII small subunit [Parachitinimonas caeni]MDK2123748.1 exodeoxyribonuclease VII small subunit [Parachitinimonas caeni]